MDLIEYFTKVYVDQPAIHEFIGQQVTEAFEQLLMESVAGALSFKNRPKWNPADFEAAVSKEALTTAVMSRFWMIAHIKRAISSRFKVVAGAVDATE